MAGLNKLISWRRGRATRRSRPGSSLKAQCDDALRKLSLLKQHRERYREMLRRRARRGHAGDVDDGLSRLYRPDRRGRAAPGERGRAARGGLHRGNGRSWSRRVAKSACTRSSTNAPPRASWRRRCAAARRRSTTCCSASAKRPKRSDGAEVVTKTGISRDDRHRSEQRARPRRGAARPRRRMLKWTA